jgi:hypothetical protein
VDKLMHCQYTVSLAHTFLLSSIVLATSSSSSSFQSSTLMASWYKECQEGLQECPNERADQHDLVRKMSDRKGAFSSQGFENEVEHLRHSLAAKKDELFESQRRCIKLKLANVQLLNRANDIDRKNRELTKHVEEVDVGFLKLIVDHGKTNKELC